MPDAAHVLFVHSSSGRYGADRQLLLIAAGLDRSRFRPLVVVPSSGPLVDDLRDAGVEVLIRPLGVIRRELASPSGAARIAGGALSDAFALRRVIQERRVALVHSNTTVVLGGAAAAGLARIPHAWHVREIYDARFGRLWPSYRRLLSRAAALPCISDATAAQFRGSERVHVIPDGLAMSADPLPRAEARRRLGLDPEVPVVAVLGRISDWKGQDVLVRALADPALAVRGTLGLIAGEAWPGAEDRGPNLSQLAAELRVSDRVRMLGFRDDVETVYGAADLVAVPSTAPEPLGDVAIEAAASGCAVVASDHGGLPEIIRDGETGRLVVAGDAGALARAAAELLEDPDLRRRMGAAAAADVRSRFSAARLLERLQNLYEGLLAGSRRG
ncbi:MAG: glycosyltransferase family 4 protein [Solirubrobacteraceae bacterium]